jgi:hypothetical protein
MEAMGQFTKYLLPPYEVGRLTTQLLKRKTKEVFARKVVPASMAALGNELRAVRKIFPATNKHPNIISVFNATTGKRAFLSDDAVRGVYQTPLKIECVDTFGKEDSEVISRTVQEMLKPDPVSRPTASSLWERFKQYFTITLKKGGCPLYDDTAERQRRGVAKSQGRTVQDVLKNSNDLMAEDVTADKDLLGVVNTVDGLVEEVQEMQRVEFEWQRLQREGVQVVWQDLEPVPDPREGRHEPDKTSDCALPLYPLCFLDCFLSGISPLKYTVPVGSITRMKIFGAAVVASATSHIVAGNGSVVADPYDRIRTGDNGSVRFLSGRYNKCPASFMLE